jgi:hypothetical protein
MPKSPKKKKNWIKVKDSQVSTHWKCPECGNTCNVGPDFFQENGTPVCTENDCDCDMDYTHTEICK